MIKLLVLHNIRGRYKSGHLIMQIARDMRLDRKTVREYVKQTDFSPEVPVRQKRKTIPGDIRDIRRMSPLSADPPMGAALVTTHS